MNTKYSVITILFIFIIPAIMLASNAAKDRGMKKPVNTETKMILLQMSGSGNMTHHWPPSWNTSTIGLPTVAPPEEDGKMHFFHFNRLRKRRYSTFLRFISKFFLLMVHLAILLFGYMHCLH